jgi:hypothetical protein
MSSAARARQSEQTVRHRSTLQFASPTGSRLSTSAARRSAARSHDLRDPCTELPSDACVARSTATASQHHSDCGMSAR